MALTPSLHDPILEMNDVESREVAKPTKSGPGMVADCIKSIQVPAQSPPFQPMRKAAHGTCTFFLFICQVTPTRASEVR